MDPLVPLSAEQIRAVDRWASALDAASAQMGVGPAAASGRVVAAMRGLRVPDPTDLTVVLLVLLDRDAGVEAEAHSLGSGMEVARQGAEEVRRRLGLPAGAPVRIEVAGRTHVYFPPPPA